MCGPQAVASTARAPTAAIVRIYYQVDMTLTTPACPAGPQILDQARREVMGLNAVYPQIEDVKINLVWTPFWNPSLMSQEARDELGFF